jgi:protein SCO1/2
MEPQHQEGPVPPRQEASLLNRRTLLVAGGALFVLVVAIHLLAAGIAGLYNFIYQAPAEQLPAASPAPVSPSQPRLQVNPNDDLQSLEATERAHISGYVWLDRESGTVRIPIERAMQLVSERGLPMASPSASPPERIKADESGFPHPTLPVGTPGPRGTPLLEMTPSQTETALATSPGTTGTPGTPTPGAAALSANSGAHPGDPPGSSDHLEAEQLAEVRFDQQPGNRLPLDLVFKDESGSEILLRETFGYSPAILVFADFDCPMLCPVILNDLAERLSTINLRLGEQYRVISMSLDPADTPNLAATRKAEILSQNPIPGDQRGWRFLTGDAPSIASLARATGFQYLYDQETRQFAHPAGLVILTPQGVIARYIAALDYSSNDLRLSLVEASAGDIGNPIDRFFLMCYAYDPVRGRYTLAITRGLQVLGVGSALALFAGILVLIRRERNGISLVPGTGFDRRRPG